MIGVQKITQVPGLPPHIRGVINPRGQVIPVRDMRLRFQLPPQEYDQRTRIVVNEVVDIPENQVEPPAAQTAGHANSYDKGLGKIGENIRILIDTEKILAA